MHRGVLLAALAAVVLCCAASSGLAVTDYPATAFGPEGMAVEHGEVLAPAPTASGDTVAGIPCGPPSATFHIHVHLEIYVDGLPRPVPAGVGLVGPTVRHTTTGPLYNAHTCYYQLHTHAQDGVIHVEAPAPRTYTLGQFFVLWGQRLAQSRVGGAIGPTRVYVDGRPTTLAIGRIPLRDRETIQIDVGSVVPPRPVNWSHF